MKFLIAFVVAIIVALGDAKPQYDLWAGMGEGGGVTTGMVNECHGVICPAGTVGCFKRTKTTENKHSLVSDIQCQDGNGNVLHEEQKMAPNPYGSVNFESTSYTQSLSFHIGSGQVDPQRHSLDEPKKKKTNYYPRDDTDDFNVDDRYNYNSRANSLDDQVETFSV